MINMMMNKMISINDNHNYLTDFIFIDFILLIIILIIKGVFSQK